MLARVLLWRIEQRFVHRSFCMLRILVFFRVNLLVFVSCFDVCVTLRVICCWRDLHHGITVCSWQELVACSSY